MTTSHSIMLTGLDADTDYYFVVNSTDASGNSAEREEYNFTTSVMIATSPMDVTADPTSVINNTANEVTFTVTSDGTPVEDALVMLLGCGVDVNDTTCPDGTATISVTATSIGTIGAKATKNGYEDAATTITVNGAVISGNDTEPVIDDFVNVTGNYTGDLTLQTLGNVTSEAGTDIGLGDMIPFKGVNVTIVTPLGDGEWVRIEMSYTDDELNEYGIDEDTLEMYKFNETTEWELIRVQPYCLDNGKGDHYFWDEVEHLCLFHRCSVKAPLNHHHRYIQ